MLCTSGCGWTLDVDSGNATKAGPFGKFDFQLEADSNASNIEAGQTTTFEFSYAGSLTGLAANDKGKLVAGKFVQGPSDDGGYGASGTEAVVPEPLAGFLLALGLMGLIEMGARQRSYFPCENGKH